MKTFSPRCAPFSRRLLFVLLAALPVAATAGEVQAWLVLNTANPAAPETIMSTDLLEKSGLVRGGWKVSGVGTLQTEAVADAGQLYRMILPLPKGGVVRMLAVTKEEADARTKVGYVTEGALGYVSLKPGSGLIPVYRFAKNGRYLWLISPADQEWAKKNGWTEGKPVFWLWAEQYRAD